MVDLLTCILQLVLVGLLGVAIGLIVKYYTDRFLRKKESLLEGEGSPIRPSSPTAKKYEGSDLTENLSAEPKVISASILAIKPRKSVQIAPPPQSIIQPQKPNKFENLEDEEEEEEEEEESEDDIKDSNMKQMKELKS